MNTPNIHIDLISKDLAYRAYCNTSFSPEKRGETARGSFVVSMQNDWEKISGIASRDMTPEFDEHLQRCIKLYTAWLSAHAQCISSMITGPANFPVARAQKRNRSESLRYDEFETFREKSIKRINKTEHPFGDGSVIYADDPQALKLLKDKLAKLEELQTTMKAANKIIRSKKDVSARLIELGLGEKIVGELQEPDCFGGLGFPSFSLTNNNAKIKNTKARISTMSKQEAQPPQEPVTFEGGTIEIDKDANRVRIYYEGKPDVDTRTALKRKAFKWAPSVKAWQRQITNAAIYDTEILLGVKLSNAYV